MAEFDITIAIPIFERLTALDAVGPYEVLQRLPGTRVIFVGKERGIVRTENGMLGLCVDATFAEIPSPNVIVFPGGIGTRTLMLDADVIGWLQKAHETTLFTTSVCTGSLVLAAAGLLNGLEATTHYTCCDVLAKFGAQPVKRRVVRQGKIITAAGVSSGIDMALDLAYCLTNEVTAKAIQLGIEYDPQPPFDSGSIDKAAEDVVAMAVTLDEKETSGELYERVVKDISGIDLT